MPSHGSAGLFNALCGLKVMTGSSAKSILCSTESSSLMRHESLSRWMNGLLFLALFSGFSFCSWYVVQLRNDLAALRQDFASSQVETHSIFLDSKEELDFRLRPITVALGAARSRIDEIAAASHVHNGIKHRDSTSWDGDEDAGNAWNDAWNAEVRDFDELPDWFFHSMSEKALQRVDYTVFIEATDGRIGSYSILGAMDDEKKTLLEEYAVFCMRWDYVQRQVIERSLDAGEFDAIKDSQDAWIFGAGKYGSSSFIVWQYQDGWAVLDRAKVEESIAREAGSKEKWILKLRDHGVNGCRGAIRSPN